MENSGFIARFLGTAAVGIGSVWFVLIQMSEDTVETRDFFPPAVLVIGGLLLRIEAAISAR